MAARKFHWPRMRSPADSTLRATLANVALFALGVAPVLLTVCTVVRLWLPLPFWDEWTTPGENLVSWSNGTLTVQELFSQHNESRKFFPRLLYLGLAKLGGWDVRQEMSITLLSVGAIAFLFYRLLRRTPGATTRAALVAGCAAAFLCFSPMQLDNFLWGIQLEVFFPGLALLVFATVNLSRLSFARKCLLNGLLALVATYTVAHGMMLWVLGIPLLRPDESLRLRNHLVAGGSYLLAAIASIAFYFVGYHRPPNHPEMLAGSPGVLDLARFLILWTGSYFQSSLANPFPIGVVALALFAVAIIASVFVIRKRGHWRTFYPAVLLAVYAGATAAITAAGRIGIGVEHALDFRYRAYSLFFYLALVALLFALHCSYFRATTLLPRRCFQGVCSIAVVLASIAWIACYADGLRAQQRIANRNLTLLRALEWIEVIPDNPDLRFLFPKPALLRAQTRVLRAHHVLRIPFVSTALAEKVRTIPSPPPDNSFGGLESCSFDLDGRLMIQGHARLPDSGRSPDCIVVGRVVEGDRFHPFVMVEIEKTTGRSDDEETKFRRKINPANLPVGAVTVRACAIDVAHEAAYPLAGNFTLTVPAR